MQKHSLIIVFLCLTACAPYVNAGNKNMVTILVPSTRMEAEALALADAHCKKYDMTAKLRKPRENDGYGKLYDYNCVK